ncbi:RagB/SusD family nutrient uptake outer membrane protein [Pontibacter qinzhouensis]|uniref:RagB/SusD family nutrient uptake outer membrane protein n=1 Tax=Pontibacter qinzhouensis TaxID=2603253 RepID=A0A5C8JHH6_9BACT|nr:RagB/SusD family nutrient uptake outer membrane protein [Pontibacter qinzhouensis]TXK36453.1 RagB/SusD family nutrient uptake outer membrane protein [Pontibacter qinzhouensis]
MKRLYLLLSFLLLVLPGCDSFLDDKPDQKLAVPATLADLQALLNEHDRMNHEVPNVGEISADNFYLTDADWAALPNEQERNQYVWAPENLFPPQDNEWRRNFPPVYVAATVLETLPAIPRTPANAQVWDEVKGQALYYRAHQLLQAAFVWALAYDTETASTDLGIPLRLTTNFNERSTRPSVQDTYDRILLDLEEAVPLLPPTRLHALRPSRAAAHALLARTCLAMRKYAEAGQHADAGLQLQPALLDYNTLDTAANYPFQRFNPEVITEHFSWGVSLTLRENIARVTPALYASYEKNDLRRSVFFRPNGDGSYAFQGSYGNDSPFGGLATDELYLTRAEATARAGRVQEALQDLNTLLATRWRRGTFVPFTAQNAQEALALILQERRKQLLQRNLRWMDIKRLNKEGAGITLQRTVQGRTYTLPPHDKRFALPLPEDVIALSGMPQNPR